MFNSDSQPFVVSKVYLAGRVAKQQAFKEMSCFVAFRAREDLIAHDGTLCW